MLEKRKYTRFALGAEIRWKKMIDDVEEPTMYRCHSRDVSAGGVCMDMCPDVSAGDTLVLEIRLADEQIIYSRGRVAWVNPLAQIKGWSISRCEGGVELLNLSDSEKSEMDNFVSKSYQS